MYLRIHREVTLQNWHVRLLVGWLVGRSVYNNFIRGKLHYQSSHRSICFYKKLHFSHIFFFIFSPTSLRAAAAFTTALIPAAAAPATPAATAATAGKTARARRSS